MAKANLCLGATPLFACTLPYARRPCGEPPRRETLRMGPRRRPGLSGAPWCARPNRDATLANLHQGRKGERTSASAVAPPLHLLLMKGLR